MKKIILFSLLLSLSFSVNAQETEEKNVASFDLDNGLKFSFNEGAYQFNIGGFIQPTFTSSDYEDVSRTYNAKNAFLTLGGKAVKEKVSFLIQMNYSSSDPLFDAWIAYHPLPSTTISFGQKQTFVNNREMTFREDRLQFTDRSDLSHSFNNTGREFGLFIESKFGTNFGIVPMLALTSGDGRNSFGSDSRDSDLGGLKIGGRLDFYPLGYFKDGTAHMSADLSREQTLKFVVGFAASQNEGTSNPVGEGHGDFMFYDANGFNELPSYSQVFIDLLVKYKGFSLLAEYANASANGLDENYTDQAGQDILIPGQISSFLVLGDSYNVQTGYVTKNGYGFDARFESSSPEFTMMSESILDDMDSYTFGLSKYFNGNNLKLQAAYTNVSTDSDLQGSMFNLLFQIGF